MNRIQLITEARRIADAAQAEGRALTAEEQSQVDRLWASVDALEPAASVPLDLDCEWEDFPP
jgi:hypothetical protein